MRPFNPVFVAIALLSWPLAAFDSEITDTARKLAVEYRKANPDVILKQALVILPLKVKDAGMQDKNIGPAVKAVLQRELVKSLIFEVTEREELQKILAEAELQQAGLTSGGKLVDFSQLRSADLLLAGEVISQNGDLRVELRLISARKGSCLFLHG